MSPACLPEKSSASERKGHYIDIIANPPSTVTFSRPTFALPYCC